MVPILIIVILLFCLVLMKSSDLAIVALRRISRRTRTGVFALSAIILAVGTSFPELFISITSAISGKTNLALGVLMGSSIADITLIAGLAAFLAGTVKVHGNTLKRELEIALFAGMLPGILILDGNLTRIDGIILLITYLIYVSYLFKIRFLEIAQEHKKESFIYRFLRKFNHVDTHLYKEIGRLIVALVLLTFSSQVIVKISSYIADLAQISIFVIGLFIIAIGTTLPELIFSLRTLGKEETSMFFGNILGSVITNSTLIVGLAALISPISNLYIGTYLVPIITFLIVYICFWYFVRSKFSLERKESLLLIFIYVMFIIITLVV